MSNVEIAGFTCIISLKLWSACLLTADLFLKEGVDSMVTVALEMHVALQRGGCPQAAGASCPCPQELASLCPISSCIPPSLTTPACVWCGLGLSPAGAGETRDSGCSHPFPVELMADDGSGGAGCQWDVCARQEWAISQMGCLSWVGCTPPVSWQGKLQAETAEETFKFLNISHIKYHVL